MPARGARGCVRRWLGVFACLAGAGLLNGRGEGFRISDAGPHLLRTGAGESLQTWSVSLAPPPGVRALGLDFTLGFGSAESAVPGDFLDSFSVSLARKVPSDTALVATADAPGVLWLPNLPGGLKLEAAALRVTEVPWALSPDQTPGAHFSYRVSLELPPVYQRGGFELIADLFDNLDLKVSLGFVADVVVRTDPFFFVESAASPQGPYAIETEAVHDPVNRVFTLVRPDRARFFRLCADVGLGAVILQPTSDAWLFRFDVVDAGGRAPREVRLQSSCQPCGPFADEMTARVTLGERRIELRRPEEVRFFRLVRSVEGEPVRIRELRVVEGSWQVVYEVIGGAE